MTSWRVADVLKFLTLSSDDAEKAGYLPRAENPFDHERLRLLLVHPSHSLNPCAAVLRSRRGPAGSTLHLERTETIVRIRRGDALPVAPHLPLKDRYLRLFAEEHTHILDAMDSFLDLEQLGVALRDGAPLGSIEQLTGHFSDALAPDDQLRVIFHIAGTVHAAPFENISRYHAGRHYRHGAEMWPVFATGWGGVCAEKNEALRFACQILGIPCQVIAGAAGRLPPDYGQQFRAFVQSDRRGEPPTWVQHQLLEIRLGKDAYLCDVAGANIPFCFLDAQDTAVQFAHAYMARMVYGVERMRLTPIADETADLLNLFTEFHVPMLARQYAFHQGLGFHIGADLFLGGFFDWGGERSRTMQQYYTARARRASLPLPRFVHEGNLDSLPSPALRDTLQDLLYAVCQNEGGAGTTARLTFVLQPLNLLGLDRARISESVKEKLSHTMNGTA
ncbi:MAG: hypothetical protein KAI66_23340 [Lentisphaeria bacterium]|nr:hypothetical protein [Lentisphaeria bacterium]